MMLSDPGDWIGQGGSYNLVYTPSNSNFFWGRVLQRPEAPGIPTMVQIVLGMGGMPEADLYFTTTKLGIPLHAGYFPDAEASEYGSEGHAGLMVRFDGRAAFSLTGQFTIYDLTYSPNGSDWIINSFAASFEQHVFGDTPALRGMITYELNPVPEPCSMVLIASGLAGFAGFRKFKKCTAG